jgi:fimbrial isopeptide formation D2 family protein
LQGITCKAQEIPLTLSLALGDIVVFSSPRTVLPDLRTRLVASSLGFIALLLFCAFNAQAQQLSIPGFQAPEKNPATKKGLSAGVRAARGEAPLNRLYDHVEAEPSKIRRLPALDPRVMQEGKSEKKQQIGVVRTFSRPIKVFSDSTLYNLAEGDVRVIGLVSEGAIHTRVHFTEMALPAGAKVFVYSAKNPEEFYGPYEGRGPSGDGTFWTPPMEGDSVAIEYFTPTGAPDSTSTPFQVSEISHIYRSVFINEDPDNAVAGSCNLDVTGEWAEVAKSVGHLQFTSGRFEYVCTGTLLNNPTNDQTPYLLTANHCFQTQAAAQSLRVYWFYNTGDTPAPGTPRTDGANLLASSSGSDFTLVRLTGSLPGGLYFSGWDANPTPISTSVTGIHHPEGSHKRISFGSTISGCASGLPGQCQNFTNVRWHNGTTEPGSSGSGLWTGPPSDPRLVGTLTGGAASCSNPSGTDYYGSFSLTYSMISYLLTGETADLAVTKVAASNQVAPGSKAVYYITASNNLGATVHAVSVTDNLPPGLTYNRCQVYNSAGSCSLAGNNLTITFYDLAAGKSATAVISATVNSSIAPDTVISNTATINSSSPDPNMSNNASTATIVVNPTPLRPKNNGKIVFGSDRAFSNSTQPSGIYTINANGAAESLLFNIEPFASAPAWSPDGTKIAYGKRGTGTYGDEIYVANADGTGSVKVAGNVFNGNRRIAWSPDGSKLAYIGAGSSIYIVSVDGTGLTKVPNIPAANDLAWSPDGSKLAFTDGSDICVMSLDGTQSWNLTVNYPSINGEKGKSILPRWFPDGNRIMFVVETNNYKNIFVVNHDRSGLAPLITLHQSTQPSFSPDGTKVTFIALNSLYVANADGTGATQITNNGFYNFNPDWQPTAVAAPAMQLSASSYSVGEAGGRVAITVNRSSATGAASVDYATSDTAAQNNCNVVNGSASSRCDYATASGTLQFAAGESSKTIFVPIVDDSISEGNENFAIALSNPVDSSLGSVSSATISITDNEVTGTPTPIKLVLDESGPDPNQASAIDSLLFLRDSFQVINAANLLNQSQDRNTRLIILVTNLQLAQGETSSAVIVNLVGSNNQSYDVAAEAVQSIPFYNFTQIVFRLPDNLSPGTCTIKVKAHGQESNTGTIRIKS